MVLGALAFAATASAVPANDDCNSAFDLVRGDTMLATTLDATDSGAARCIGTDDLDVWFYFRPAVTRAYDISTCGSTFDTTLSVFEGCGGPVVACANDSVSCGFGNNAEIVGLTLNSGTDYFFRVAGANSNVGNIAIRVDPTTLNPPSNDECSSARDVTLGVPITATSVDATDSGSPRCDGTDNLDVWFYYQPEYDQLVNISTCGSDFDTTLSVFDGCGGPVVACNDDSATCTGNPSNASLELLPLEGHRDYFIRVAGYLSDEGNIDLLVDSPTPPPVHVPLAPWPAVLALTLAAALKLRHRK